ncbi:hypothetical protein HDV00_006481 [Rhizophlyctis rosea]|nr:hypothetical protein HDV00_006481 [Rhizophlyctis rosea]
MALNPQVHHALPTLPINRTILLFPTLHSMTSTPAGRFIQYLAQSPFRDIGAFTIGICQTLLPTSLFRTLVGIASGQRGRDLEITCGKLLTGETVLQALTLAECEMREVGVLGEEMVRMLERLSGKLTFYYGVTDHWCPVSHYEDMKGRFPDGKISVLHIFI